MVGIKRIEGLRDAGIKESAGMLGGWEARRLGDKAHFVYKFSKLSSKIIKAAINVHKMLGPVV